MNNLKFHKLRFIILNMGKEWVHRTQWSQGGQTTFLLSFFALPRSFQWQHLFFKCLIDLCPYFATITTSSVDTLYTNWVTNDYLIEDLKLSDFRNSTLLHLDFCWNPRTRQNPGSKIPIKLDEIFLYFLIKHFSAKDPANIFKMKRSPLKYWGVGRSKYC